MEEGNGTIQFCYNKTKQENETHSQEKRSSKDQLETTQMLQLGDNAEHPQQL